MHISLFCLGAAAVSYLSAPSPSSYYEWITDCLAEIKADVGDYAVSAEHAARLFALEDYGIGAWGDPAFVGEFSGRAGGLMRVVYLRQVEDIPPNTIILISPRQDHVESDLREAAAMKGERRLLVLFARAGVISLAKKLGLSFDYIVDTHAAPHGGLVRTAGGRWIVPTDRAASIAAMWAWTGEFVAACTRLGKMPVMWQSLSVPGAEKRAARYRKLKFHDSKPVPVERCRIGRQYIEAVLRILDAVRTGERGRIESVADQARSATASGHRFYVCGAGHATKHGPAAVFDPRVFTFISEGEEFSRFKPGDFLFLVGYDEHWLDAQLGPISRECRRLGGKLAWTLSTYGSRQTAGVEPGETLVDQHWELGDGVVSLPGYDIGILPSSGVVAEAVLWMVVERLIAHR